MPIDTKRIQGPEISQSPLLYREAEEKVPLISETGKRRDGRTPQEIRPVFLKAGVVSQARGSAYIEARNTKVLCAVYGPREVPRREGFSMSGQLRCEFKFASFSCRYRRSHVTDSAERELGLQVQQALEPAVCLHKIPKSQVDVFVTVLENDGSALAAAITCASVAVANAGIEMYDIVIGCTVRQAGKSVLLDPTEVEEYHGLCEKEPSHASVTAGVLPSLNQVSGLVQKGQLKCDDSIKALQQCVDGSQRMYPVIYECLKKSIKKLKPPPTPDSSSASLASPT
ncbi:exosome complex component MTR3-like [Diadema antillarum]|uniref:exosome complex component MTR3-like n=1 Tax=Diadema antillarum TaxID=105358 RepID=UPI003A85B561